jgi:hypothetical protein
MDLQSHLLAHMPRSFKEGEPPDIISCEKQRVLKNRKHTGQSLPQPEKWKEIYHILFPGRNIPDPSTFACGSNIHLVSTWVAFLTA